MRFVAKYQQLAYEYRKLSQQLSRPKDKGALALMARAWDKIAMEREYRVMQQLMDRQFLVGPLESPKTQRKSSACRGDRLGS